VIISHEHKFVFVHNPKVAGTAIHQALEQFHDDPIQFWHQRFFRELDRVVDAAHLTLHDLKLVRPQVFDGSYRFLTVVRDPYTRFVSAIAEHCRQHQTKVHSEFYPEVFKSWLDNLDETNLRFNWKYIHLCPQHYFTPQVENDYHWVCAKNELKQNWRHIVAFLFREERSDIQLPTARVRADDSPLNLDYVLKYNEGLIERIYHQDFVQFDFDPKTCSREPRGHYERVNGIHSPYLEYPSSNICTLGERIALDQQLRLLESK
jgi:hypothetical protein